MRIGFGCYSDFARPLLDRFDHNKYQRRQQSGRGMKQAISRLLAIVMSTLVVSLLFALGCSEKKPDLRARTSGTMLAAADPQVRAQVRLLDVIYATDQRSLAGIAYDSTQEEPINLAEFTLVLVDALDDATNTPLGGSREESEATKDPTDSTFPEHVLDIGPPSHHDLTILGGRAAYVLEQIYGTALPAVTRKKENETRQTIERDALRKLVLELIRKDRDVAQLKVSERLRVAKSIDTPIDVLQTLTQDPNDEVVLAVAKSRGDHDFLAKLIRKRAETIADPSMRQEIEDSIKESRKSPVGWVRIEFNDKRPPVKELMHQAIQAAAKNGWRAPSADE
jgi:hypothetical protein